MFVVTLFNNLKLKFMSTTTSPNFFQKCLAWVENIFDEAPTIERSIAKFADEVTNKIKVLEPTAEAIGTFLENELVPIAEAIDPALTPMISGLELALPKTINTVSNVVGAISNIAAEPESEQVAQGLSAIQNLKGVDGTIYGNVLGAISTSIANFVTTNNGIVATTADLISTQQAVHSQSAV